MSGLTSRGTGLNHEQDPRGLKPYGYETAERSHQSIEDGHQIVVRISLIVHRQLPLNASHSLALNQRSQCRRAIPLHVFGVGTGLWEAEGRIEEIVQAKNVRGCDNDLPAGLQMRHSLTQKIPRALDVFQDLTRDDRVKKPA